MYLRGNIIHVYNGVTGKHWIGVVTRNGSVNDMYVTARFVHPVTGEVQEETQNVSTSVVTYVGDVPAEAEWDIC